MTKRLYYDDSYLTRFTARIVEQLLYQGRPAVVLDRTAFYPTSGGQPFDQGSLDGVKVVEVLVRETDDAVLHLLQTPMGLTNQSTEITGEIDWKRRFDHMQQHSGQHILSQAFIQAAQAETVSFHLGVESVTIDVAGPQQLSPQIMEQVEALSNRIVWDDRPIIARIVGPAELANLPLRKPPLVSGDVRIVQVEDFDCSACGGTHVARSGQVGMIKIIKWEKRGADKTRSMRVEFRCGWRALRDYHQKNDMVNRVAAGFNVGYWELDQAVERQKAETKDLRLRLRQTVRALIKYEAAALRAAAPSVAGVRLVVHHLPAEIVPAGNVYQDNMRELAHQLVSEPGVVALMGAGDKALDRYKVQFCFARSADVEIDMATLVRDTVATIGSRGGGGKPDFAQGGGLLIDKQQLDAVLQRTAQKLCEQLERAE